jgi:hypothetical protein
MVTAVPVPVLMASAGMLFGTADLPFLSVMMAFLMISALDGLSQLMGTSVFASGVSGTGQFNKSRMCSAHQFSCPLVAINCLQLAYRFAGTCCPASWLSGTGPLDFFVLQYGQFLDIVFLVLLSF